MKHRVVDFFAGSLLVFVYLLLAGVAGSSDPDVDQANAEARAAVPLELVCSEAGDVGADAPLPARPFLVSSQDTRAPLVFRCVAR